MDARELAIELHRELKGDTHFVSEQYRDEKTGRMRTRQKEVPFADEERLEGVPWVIFTAEDGYPASRPMTYAEIGEAFERVLHRIQS